MTPSEQHPSSRRNENPRRHLVSFAWMILFTAIAFALVGTEFFSSTVTFAIILILAALQVILQLFTFMHLDKRSQLPILFMASGIGLSIIFAVSMWLWK